MALNAQSRPIIHNIFETNSIFRVHQGTTQNCNF